ncbi:MAG: hypothetical protein NTZ05_08230 [Chloroflexi bacterium]|nr:hypothetical protein [Chloroflexota bacterium]
MAQGYKCRKCGWTVTVGVPQVRITQEVSAVLSEETGRPITFHDWGPHAINRFPQPAQRSGQLSGLWRGELVGCDAGDGVALAYPWRISPFDNYFLPS